jgi:hypothetical protein
MRQRNGPANLPPLPFQTLALIGTGTVWHKRVCARGTD